MSFVNSVVHIARGSVGVTSKHALRIVIIECILQSV